MEHGDRLTQADSQVPVQRRLPALALGLAVQLSASLSRRLGLSFQHPAIQGLSTPPTRCFAQPGYTVPGVKPLSDQQVPRLTLDFPGQPQAIRPSTPPA